MDRRKGLFCAAFATLLLASAAEAKVLEGPMLHGNGSDFFNCSIVNLSATKTLEVQIEVWDHDSQLGSPSTTSLAPGEGTARLDGWSGIAGWRRCRFIVPGSTKGFAASMGTGASLHTPAVVIPIK